MTPFSRALACSVVLAFVAVVTACGPIGPFPGGRLRGEELTWPSSWERAARVEEVQLETRPDDPHSVNVWIVVVDGSAFVATSLLAGVDDPTDREWVRNVAADPSIRIRLEGDLYPARFEIVTDDELLTRLVEAFQTKYPQLKKGRVSGAHFYKIVRREM